MGHLPGTKIESYKANGSDGERLGAVRTLVFVSLLVMSVLIFAGVVLLPPYGNLKYAEYQRDFLHSVNTDAEKLIEANHRLLDALDEDQVLAIRLACSQSDFLPFDEIVFPESPLNDRPGPLVTIQNTPRPEKPSGLLMQLSGKLEKANRRRGLMLLAVGALLVGLLLLNPKYVKT